MHSLLTLTSCVQEAGGIKAMAYHAGKNDTERINVQNSWRSGDTQVPLVYLRAFRRPLPSPASLLEYRPQPWRCAASLDLTIP